MTRTLAVIGGGASAVLLLAALARRPGARDLQITVFERADGLGRGIAYSRPHLCHLLNVRASGMSAHAAAPDHFARWAAGQGFAADAFVPRLIYGIYLDSVLEEARQTLHVDFVHADVTAAVRDGAGYRLTAGGRDRSFDLCVLASGNVASVGPVLRGEVAGYHENPWEVDYAALAGTARSVGIVGSGLSAVDCALALDAAGCRGVIRMVSRGGRLPGVHVAARAYGPFLTGAERALRPAALLARVRREVRAADAPWQAVIDSLRPDTNAIWQGWSAADRGRFLRRLFTVWNVHRHRMAPEIAAALDRLRGEGRLAITKDSVLRVERGPVIAGEKADYPCDAVINALGYRYAERGRDFAVSAKIGPARFGTGDDDLFETTAIPEIRAQAAVLAEELTG